MEREYPDIQTTTATPGAPAAPPTGPPAPLSPAEEAAALKYFTDYRASHGIPDNYANVDAAMNDYRGYRQQGMSHDQALQDIPNTLAWASYKAPAAGGGDPGGTGGVDPGTTNPNLGSLFQPFTGTYTKPDTLNLGGPAGIEYIPPAPALNLGTFKAPPAFQYKDFELPGLDEVYADPSYQLRRDEGQRGIESSAAAKGRVRTGGNLMDVLKYNQNFASSEYGNIVDRKLGQYRENRGNALDTYNTNYKTQVTDPYAFNEEAAKAAFAPLFAQWTTQGQAGQRQNEINSDQGWAQFLQKYREFDDSRKFKYGVLSDQERLGLDAASR